MTPELTQFRAELLADIRAIVEEALAVGARPAPPGGGMVGADYVAKLFGCSVYSVRMGKAGTAEVRWTSRRPLRCTREEAHAALQRWTDGKRRPEKPRKKGLIRRS